MSSFSPIAIVGQGCVLPGALTPEALWAVVSEARTTISRAPDGEWRVAGNVDRAKLARETATGTGGYVRGFESVFDARGFAIDTTGLDPVFLWTLHAAREALRSAGVRDGSTFPRGAVVLGNLSYPVPALVELALDTWGGANASVDARNRFQSGLPATLTARALGFGLGGFSLDAACASSLYAIKLACDRLHDGSTDIALAGGVNHADGLFLHLGFTALGASSPTGQSRPFHRGADGLVPSHGAAMVVLRRLEDAEANGETILGVIRGVGLSNDGRGRGLLVPVESGQVRAMRAAYEMSGLSPKDISLVECHATGTVLGDATELRSMLEVFDGARDVPIGSLKSNLGHLITASGAAGLLKVIAAMRAGVRPATLHVEEPVAELDRGPMRLLKAAESWTCDGPRRAAISNFGFGGNNAHLIVEQWVASAPAAAAKPVGRTNGVHAAVKNDDTIAVIAQSVIAGKSAGTRAFESALFEGPAGPIDSASFVASAFELDIARLRLPPADLEASLPQQLLLLRAALEIDEVLRKLPAARTSLVVGMQCDAEVARCSVPWRFPGTTADLATQAPLTSAIVLGCMPNIVANRIGSQFDFQGPSFTVSGDEASGLVALDVAAAALRAHETDAAVVGAVDLSCEPVHAAARARVDAGAPGHNAPGDAAVILVLKRLSDAQRDGDTVLATLASNDQPQASSTRGFHVGPTSDGAGLSALFGHAHAASGLLHVAAAVSAVARRALPRQVERPAVPLLPQNGARAVRVDVDALGGTRASVSLRGAPGKPAHRIIDSTRLAVFGAADMDGLVRALQSGHRAPGGAFRLAIAADGDAELEAKIARAAAWLSTHDGSRASLEDGVHFGKGPMPGELGFVFTGPAGAYPNMGRELALAFPELVDALGARMSTLRDASSWIYEAGPNHRALPVEKLWGSSFLIQLHAELTRGLLGMRPTAAIGYCSGETNALFAMGAWDDLDGFREAIDAQAVYTRELSGELRCVHEAWNAPAGSDVRWSALRVRASLDDVRRAIDGEPRVHLTIVNAPGDVVIAGDSDGCARVAAKIGAHRVRSIDYDFVMHCPEARPYAKQWHALHHRPTAPVKGVRFYTHATLSSYAPTADAVADALTGQAMNVVDFPAMVERAYADGVRVFVEHGPHGGCTKWIGEVLGAREHVAVALDRYGRSSLLEAADGIARFAAAGVVMDASSFAARLAAPLVETAPSADAGARAKIMKSFPAHRDPVRLPATPSPVPVVPHGAVQVMAPAPKLPLAMRAMSHSPVAHSAAAQVVESAPADHALAQLMDLHRAYLHHQSATHEEFMNVMLGTSPVPQFPDVPRAVVMNEAVFINEESPAHVAPPPPVPAIRQGVSYATPLEVPSSVTHTSAPRKGPRPPVGPSYTRAELVTLSSGKISSVFGPLFAKQDSYERQVRMPEPPLLLADRVLGIEGEPGEMGTGAIWTETDVTPGAWYLNQGRMPAGILVESGQADLLLISWLGVDFLNRGERVYRLLGCELTAHGELPRIGDTLTYEIHVDGHANQGDVRLFFFHYDCWVNGELRVTVRNGQAGFFTTEELAGSAGVIWSADDTKPTPAATARLDAPKAVCTKSHFTAADIDAFVAGDGYDCFGPGFERLATHTLTPSIQSGNMRLLDEVTHFDAKGGPWGRGYLRARLALKPDHWFFKGHFKNDPCMPGTLMFEGCFQALGIYMAALGYTIDCDGWRFEPVPDAAYHLRCRGQALPTSKEVVYEVFIDEIVEGPVPMLYADLLGTVDGLKAFHCKRMGLRLIPAWPMDRGRLPVEIPSSAGLVSPSASLRSGTIARAGDFQFDYRSLLSCALGRPSEAFGEMYAPFDGTRRVARLPGPPYHFMSRVARVLGPCGGMEVGSVAEVVYDVPPDAWYFSAGPRPVMPYAVLLEVALQPCGWLASYIGSARSVDKDLVFRNLDGTGTVHREVPSDIGSITTTTKLTSLSTAGGLIILGFEVSVTADSGPIYTFTTVFGFFPPEAMKNQIGLPTTPALLASLAEPSDTNVSLRDEPAQFFTGALRLPAKQLLMIDQLTGVWPKGGKAGLGRVRAEKHVDPREWFFKAHFFQDPVQPGSLGIEALLQALQALMIATKMEHGIASPVFEPIASGSPMTWKYRGQIVPETPNVVVDLEVTHVEEDARGRVVYADGSLWAGDKRVYEVKRLGMRIAPERREAEGETRRDATRPDSRTPGFDRACAKDFWRNVTGANGPWAGEDILFGMVDHFVGKVVLEDAAAIAARRGKGAIYVANHQVAVETILAAIVLGGVTGTVPTLPAKSEHRDTWVGQLTELLNARPGLRDPRLLRFIDREDPTSVLRLVEELKSALGAGRSVLVHVEGTRATSCRQHVSNMSSVFLDLAIETDVDVIPVRFTSGLPIAPAAERLEVPVGYGKQDYWIGRPIAARELRALPFASRAKSVLAAINALGVTPENEAPSAPDAQLERAVHEWRSAHRVSEPQAAMAVALAGLADASEEGRALLAEVRAGVPTNDASPLGQWRSKLGAWLLGRA